MKGSPISHYDRASRRFLTPCRFRGEKKRVDAPTVSAGWDIHHCRRGRAGDVGHKFIRNAERDIVLWWAGAAPGQRILSIHSRERRDLERMRVEDRKTTGEGGGGENSDGQARRALIQGSKDQAGRGEEKQRRKKKAENCARESTMRNGAKGEKKFRPLPSALHEDASQQQTKKEKRKKKSTRLSFQIWSRTKARRGSRTRDRGEEKEELLRRKERGGSKTARRKNSEAEEWT